MKKQNVAKNYLYNVIYQILTFVTPIITAPYLSRTLGAENIGVYNYTYSIVYWFILFGMMGISIYGNKEVAKVSDDKDKLSKKFSEIFFLQLFNMILSLILFYLIFIFGNFKYKIEFLIQGMLILAAAFDISWLYVGMENFKKTTIRNFIVKIFMVFGIFVFVKSRQDLYRYTLFLSVMNIVSQLILWIGLRKILSIKKVKINDIIPHIKDNIILFIPQIATSLYCVFDQTMIGLLYNNVSEVGFYSQAHKLVNMILFIVTTIGTVMLPRAVKIKENDGEKRLLDVTNFTLKIALFLSIPLSIGFACIASFFIPWFLSAEFTKVGYIISFLCPIIIFISITNVIGYQHLIVNDRTKHFTISVTAGCIFNLILNLILIPRFGAYGASISSVITEILVFFIQYFFTKKTFNYIGILSKFFKYLCIASLMGGLIVIIGLLMKPNIFTNAIQFLAGFFIYNLVMYLSKDDVQKFLINKFFEVFKIKKKNDEVVL